MHHINDERRSKKSRRIASLRSNMLKKRLKNYRDLMGQDNEDLLGRESLSFFFFLDRGFSKSNRESGHRV